MPTQQLFCSYVYPIDVVTTVYRLYTCMLDHKYWACLLQADGVEVMCVYWSPPSVNTANALLRSGEAMTIDYVMK